MTTRADWAKAVRSAKFPAGLRVIRGTLLCLAPMMTTDGILAVRAEKLSDETGLYPRTLRYHLARAVETGWLEHEVRGGNGRGSRYRAADPSCRQEVAHKERELSATHSPQHAEVAGNLLVPNSAEVVGNLVAYSIKTTASVSEHVAVDQQRATEIIDQPSRVSTPAAQEQQLIEESPDPIIAGALQLLTNDHGLPADQATQLIAEALANQRAFRFLTPDELVLAVTSHLAKETS
jgi:hypothetical protein